MRTVAGAGDACKLAGIFLAETVYSTRWSAARSWERGQGDDPSGGHDGGRAEAPGLGKEDNV